MSEQAAAPAHSPAPFDMRLTPNGFILIDAMGDSIGALAGRTGDHPPEEQLANAFLFMVSPELLAALRDIMPAAEYGAAVAGNIRRPGHKGMASAVRKARAALDAVEPRELCA